MRRKEVGMRRRHAPSLALKFSQRVLPLWINKCSFASDLLKQSY